MGLALFKVDLDSSVCWNIRTMEIDVVAKEMDRCSVFAVQLLHIVWILTPFLPTRMHLANNKI